MPIPSPYDDEKSRGYVRRIVFVVMAVLGPLLAYGINREAEEKARYEAEHYQEERAQITLTKIRAFLLNATQLAETLRVLVEQNYSPKIQDVETYLDRIVESAPEDLIYGAGVWYEPRRFDGTRHFVGPYVHRGPRSGTRVLSHEWENPGYNFHRQEWYQNAIHGQGRATFTDPYFDNGQVYMTLALSFNDRKSGMIRGVITVDMILPQLQSLIDSVNENSSDVISVIGKSGRLLAHPQNFSLLQRARDAESPAQIKSLLDVPESYFNQPNWNSIVSKMRMKENGWTVVVASPKTSIMAGYLSQRTLIIALTIFFEVSLLIIYFLMSFFDEGISRLKERSFQAIMVERNQIKAIVDNVQFGLFRADRRGRIQSGYSQSCPMLFSLDAKSDLTRRVFWHYFDLNRREEDNFEAFYEQIFEVPFLAQEMAEQIPSQFQVHGKTLACRYYPILKGDIVESVLVTFSDVSISRLTAEENESNKALLRVLRNRDRFLSLISEVLDSDDSLLSPQSWPAMTGTQALRKIKRIVHTWKGDFSTFGLHAVAAYMHALEDRLRPNLNLLQSQDAMRVIKTLVESYLDQNQNILHISSSSLKERTISVSESEILGIRNELLAADSLELARARIETFVERSTMDRAETTLAYLSLAAQDLAQRQEKDIRIDLKGAEIKIPHAYGEVMASLIHVVRNAVDHGLEKPRDRKDKAPTGILSIAFSEAQDHYLIQISDDGRGINCDKVKERVIAQGLVSPNAWDLLTPEEQLLFVFEESVTTQANVSLISGRGVGLDRVHAAVTEQGGNIRISSTPGFGTSFEIRLPLIPPAKSRLAKSQRNILVS